MNLCLARRSPSTPLALVALLTLTLLGAISPSSAQAQGPPADTAVRPLRPSFGWPINDFILSIGAARFTPGFRDSAKINDIWYYVHRDGGNALCFVPASAAQCDQVHNSIFRDSADRVFLVSPVSSKQWRAGFGREVQFYPFDSVQSPFYVCRFDSLSGGVMDTNLIEKSYYDSTALQEQIYNLTNTAPGQMIASRPLFGVVDSTASPWNELIANGHGLEDSILARFNWLHIAVRGHMIDNPGSAADNDSVLRFELWHIIKKDHHYLRTTTDSATAASDTAILVATWNISKGELKTGAPAISLAKYREVVQSLNLDTTQSGGPGPTHFKQFNRWDGSRQLDLRVFWTGVEPVALRSVAMRDEPGQNVLGNRHVDSVYRKDLINELWRKLYGTSSRSVSPDSLRTEFIRLQTGHEAESFPTEYAGFERMNRMFRDTFNLAAKRALHGESPQPGDSIPAWQQNWGSEHSQYLSTPDDITYEAASAFPYDTVSRWFGSSDTTRRSTYIYETPHHTLPRFKHHDGGRGHLPLLIDTALLGTAGYDTTLNRRIEDYETTLQNLIFGRNNDTLYTTYSERVGFTGNFANVARVGRRYGRRTMMFYYFYTNVQQRYDTATHTFDTLLGPRMEPAELLANANLALCYGAHGITWMNVGTQTAVAMQPLTNNGVPVYDGGNPVYITDPGWACCFGAQGRYSDEDTADVINLPFFYDNVLSTPRFTVPNYYSGYKTVMQAMRTINKNWLRTMGPIMAKLRWRDGYSIHYTTPRTDAVRDLLFRPIAPNAIVESVRASDRWGHLDSLSRTFVELGLFYPQSGAGGYDTNWVYLVNRRSFETPWDLPDSTPHAKQLDSLAEWRRVEVCLNLRHPADNAVYTFAHIKEVNPDTTRAPWMTAPRAGLDTMVAVGAGTDSTFALWMRPGGGALIRVTYINPDPTLVTGDLRYNNARHTMWDGTRWHLCYALLDGPDASSYTDQIVWRWSEPADSITPLIRWQGSRILSMPNPDLVPCDSGGVARFQNRHPSLAIFRSGDTARVTVTWTCHKPAWAPSGPGREVVARSLLLIDTGSTGGAALTMGPLHHVNYYLGSWLTPWGTPVVSMWHGGECFSWSDSIAGIMAQLRLNAGQWNSCTPNIWSNTLGVSAWLGYSINPSGQFPTMAPLAHVHGRDSSNGLAWQQPTIAPPGMNDIVYTRLVQGPTGGTPPAPTLVPGNYFVVNDQLGPGKYYHPSMDLWQHPFDQCNEGITWEEQGPVEPRLWYRSLNTIISYYSAPDTIRPVNGWGYQSYWLPPDTAGPGNPFGWIWPNVGARNEAWDPATQFDSAYMAIAYEDSLQGGGVGGYRPHRMWETQIKFGDATIKGSFPKLYSFDGRYPVVTASQTRQAEHGATIYEEPIAPNTRQLTSTRQFFARTARPRGYLAVGRELLALDTSRTGAAAGVIDVWVGDDDSTRAVAMTGRDTTTRYIDTLAVAESLLHSASFTSHDSAVVGLRATARFIGDSASALETNISVKLRWELINETDGSVVAVLDSATIDAAHPRHDSTLAVMLDLVSSSYHVRMAADTSNLAPRPLLPSGSRWPVIETSTWVEENIATKAVRTGDARGSRTRLEVQPNPATDRTEVMVSIPEQTDIRITLTSIDGRAVGTVYEGTLERGRYAVPVALGNVAPGAYIVELTAGHERRVQKLIVR